MGKLHLVLGGQKSGKSSHAEALAHERGAPVVVLTPAVVRDPEFAARVARHKADRPGGWRTVERIDIDAALSETDDVATVIVDALDSWLAETLFSLDFDIDEQRPSPEQFDAAHGYLRRRLAALADASQRRSGDTIVVAGQPGLGAHVTGAGARAYVDLHGMGIQQLSKQAASVVVMIAGRPLSLPARPLASGVQHAVPDVRLREHGDTHVRAGGIDVAVNVEPGPPEFLKELLREALPSIAAYPDDSAARDAIARRHGRSPDECLVVAGAAEAFWLIPQVLDIRLAVMVHPGFTEPEAALHANGVPVVQVFRDPDRGWRFDPTAIPEAADLVVIGRPNNPTGSVDPADDIAAVLRPGRLVVIDEAFAEFLPDAGGLATHGALDGLLVVRSLTKIWGLAGLRVGYVVASPDRISRLGAHRQPWNVSTLSLEAITQLVEREAERLTRATDVARRRERLHAGLEAIDGLRVWDSHANFLLVQGPESLVDELVGAGFAPRPASTFPGLDRTFLRLTVKDDDTNDRLVVVIVRALSGHDDG